MVPLCQFLAGGGYPSQVKPGGGYPTSVHCPHQNWWGVPLAGGTPAQIPPDLVGGYPPPWVPPNEIWPGVSLHWRIIQYLVISRVRPGQQEVLPHFWKHEALRNDIFLSVFNRTILFNLILEEVKLKFYFTVLKTICYTKRYTNCLHYISLLVGHYVNTDRLENIK